jgi:hypothetical protein
MRPYSGCPRARLSNVWLGHSLARDGVCPIGGVGSLDALINHLPTAEATNSKFSPSFGAHMAVFALHKLGRHTLLLGSSRAISGFSCKTASSSELWTSIFPL